MEFLASSQLGSQMVRTMGSGFKSQSQFCCLLAIDLGQEASQVSISSSGKWGNERMPRRVDGRFTKMAHVKRLTQCLVLKKRLTDIRGAPTVCRPQR